MSTPIAAIPGLVRALCGCAVVALPGAAMAQEPLDLLRDRVLRHGLQVPVYVPKVPAQVRCLRSAEQAREFSLQAWGEDKKELHVDFAEEQILVVAWGRIRRSESAADQPIELFLERATIENGVLRAAVRSVLPPGPGIDVPPEAPGRDLYPSLFVRTPRTERCVVEVFGARRSDRRSDLDDRTPGELTVRVAPDASPARERLTPLLPIALASAAEPAAGMFARAGKRVFELSWGRLGAGSYRLDLVGAEVAEGTARLVVRAESREIVIYSGPGEHRPGLALALPDGVERVHVHVERVGMPLAPGEVDFVATKEPDCELTVDRTAVRIAR